MRMESAMSLKKRLSFYNNPSYSHILIGSCLLSIRGQTHDWRHHQLLWHTQWHTRLSPRVPLFCSYHILTSSLIYYWTDARQHGIYLLNKCKLCFWRHPFIDESEDIYLKVLVCFSSLWGKVLQKSAVGPSLRHGQSSAPKPLLVTI